MFKLKVRFKFQYTSGSYSISIFLNKIFRREITFIYLVDLYRVYIFVILCQNYCEYKFKSLDGLTLILARHNNISNIFFSIFFVSLMVSYLIIALFFFYNMFIFFIFLHHHRQFIFPKHISHQRSTTHHLI